MYLRIIAKNGGDILDKNELSGIVAYIVELEGDFERVDRVVKQMTPKQLRRMYQTLKRVNEV